MNTYAIHTLASIVINDIDLALEKISNKVWNASNSVYEDLSYICHTLAETAPEDLKFNQQMESYLLTAMLMFEQFREYDATFVTNFDINCFELIGNGIRKANS